ncbi:glycosyltransferase family 2 protein [Aquirufa antheringensis]|uniref:glycosyltransferase family 2 protein n=1 Tax=Aquirufa antheringensis TaxID=2516559 RepID=UPI0022A86E69|nr:hypothetical protein [Aquirufa antheringensis]MCZ2486954.1 hypothetical protein [Aquirufa antheringensis]
MKNLEINKYYIVSICIPTNGRIDVVINTLDSIFKDKRLCLDDFEVVLSDNSDDDQLKEALKSYSSYSNIQHKKSKEVGFLNSINSLKLGQGFFLKLHNNYTMFEDGKLFDLIEYIRPKISQKPFIFFSNNGKFENRFYNSFDNFSCELSYWNSWSTGFSIWKSDLDILKLDNVDVMFPHVTLFFEMRNKGNFILNDQVYFINQDVLNKGGYDLFKVFAVDYLTILNNQRERQVISKKTFEIIKRELFNKFLTQWYINTYLVNNSYTFIKGNIYESVSHFYGFLGYFRLILRSIFFLFFKKTYYLLHEKKRE